MNLGSVATIGIAAGDMAHLQFVHAPMPRANAVTATDIQNQAPKSHAPISIVNPPLQAAEPGYGCWPESAPCAPPLRGGDTCAGGRAYGRAEWT